MVFVKFDEKKIGQSLICVCILHFRPIGELES